MPAQSPETLGKAAYNLHIMKCVIDGKAAPPAWERLSEADREQWRQRGINLAAGGKRH
jgi:hypothetical protein